MVLCIPNDLEKKNNEDLQNAKRHMGVSLIAAASYQSLKQMVYLLRGFVLDMSTTPHRGDLLKMMHTKDDGVHFKANLLFYVNAVVQKYFDNIDTHYYCR